MRDTHYDLVVIGSSFASSFFLLEALQHAGPEFRVLVLEKGLRLSHASRLQAAVLEDDVPIYRNVGEEAKPWVTNTMFGGCSHCWWGCTPRFLPEDFELHSRYGVGVDWPIGYSDLEPYYLQAEKVMAVSGEPFGLLWRSAPFPQPPHLFNQPDEILGRRFPNHYTIQPCARTRTRTSNRRQCCASGTCSKCPRDAKFTIENELSHLYDRDSRVELELNAEALVVETQGDRATGVTYRGRGRRERTVRADFVALGANALFNPVLLIRSGLGERWTGVGLHEQRSAAVAIDLRGVDNFQGSTSVTGLGYMLYSRPERRTRASALIENHNTIRLRPERGRYRETMWLKAIVEDLPGERNRVSFSERDGMTVDYNGISEYCQAGLDALDADLQPLLSALPVENYTIDVDHARTEAHIIGTTRMSLDQKGGVVDRDLIHHRIRNLAVLGSGCFPTSTPSNPTLTLSALSLRSARATYGPGALR